MPSVDQQLIKNNNQKNLFEHIRKNPGISRATLAKCCHLSKPAVSDLTAELIQNHFIYDTGVQDSPSAGRRPNGLELKPCSHYVVVFYFGHAFLQMNVVDLCGYSAYKIQQKREPSLSYAKQAKSSLDELLASRFHPDQIIGICFIVPAMIDLDREEIYSTTLPLSDAEAAQIIPELKNLFADFHAAVLNDTACLAYAEKVYGPVEEEDFAFINFDRGIGATLFIHNQMLGKASAFYTQFGHISVDMHGPLCPCGNRGCLERMIGEAYLDKSYAQLRYLATSNDAQAVAGIDQIADYLSFALCNLVSLIHPKCIILGGNAYQLGTFFLKALEKKFSERGFRRMMNSLTLRYSKQGAESGDIGAMKYFVDQYFNFSVDCAGLFHIG